MGLSVNSSVSYLMMDAISDDDRNQWHSMRINSALSGNQWHSAAISGNQWHSAAISGTQRHSVMMSFGDNERR